MPEHRWRSVSPGRRSFFRIITATIIVVAFSLPSSSLARAQSAASATWSVTIVLPPKVVAGQQATLAVFGADGSLAPGVVVDLGKNQKVTTDASGRALFTAPAAGGVVLARASGASAAALVDPGAPPPAAPALSVAPFLSVRDRFSICSSGFRAEADANRILINGERALILAASPECVVALPGPKATPGAVMITAQTASGELTAASTLVSLLFESPQPPPVVERKSRLVVQVLGSEQPLSIVVENQTPGVLRFLRGDREELRTTGGAQNSAEVEIQALRTGDFSFHARLLPVPDPITARRYLEAAQPLAGRDLRHRLKKLANRLARHPRDIPKVRLELDGILSVTIEGDLRTLLGSARSAL
jgi:hypothetical protein